MFHSIDVFIVAIFILVEWRITVLLLRAAGRRPAVRLAVYGFNAVILAGYACTFSVFNSALPVPPAAAMLLGAGTLFYLVLATLMLAVHTAIQVAQRLFAPQPDSGRRRVLRAAGQVLMAAPVAAIGYGCFIERHQFRVHEEDIPFAGLPEGLDGLRILHLSDIHLGAFLGEREFARVIDTSNELRAHLAVVTGDLISSRGDPLDACIRQVARLKSDAGIFGCLGNHERYARAENYTEEASSRAGIRFLRGHTAPLEFGGAHLNLAGVDYERWNPRHEYLHGAEAMLLPGAWNVLLSHNPDVLPAAAERGYNLVLSGHTHGGQVSVEILDQSINPARFFTPYIHGLYRAGAAAGYVTRGIGTIGIPARLGAPPEISLLRLRRT